MYKKKTCCAIVLTDQLSVHENTMNITAVIIQFNVWNDKFHEKIANEKQMAQFIFDLLK